MNKTMLLMLQIACHILPIVPMTVHANELAIGAGVIFMQSAYKDYDNQVSPLPLIHYDNEYIFLKGTSAGVYSLKTENHQIYAQITYQPWEFKTSKTNDIALKQLYNRKASVMAGLGYSYMTDLGNTHLSLLTDITNKNKGVIIDFAYGYPISIGEFFIEPGIGIQWQNRKYNDYYYGISKEESIRSGLSQYKAESGSTPYIAFNANYSF